MKSFDKSDLRYVANANNALRIIRGSNRKQVLHIIDVPKKQNTHSLALQNVVKSPAIAL